MMAQLFSKGTILDEIKTMPHGEVMEKLAIVQKIYDDHLKGLTADETRYEQNFNQLFFNELLGYQRNDNMHPKASTPVGGKIADLGLGIFAEGKYSFEGVQIAVELKGSKVFLDKKQNRENSQSPVDQGFGYKTSFQNCKWLIVSNFQQIRLYRDNKQDYEEWTLQELIHPEHEYFGLRKLLVLVSRSRLLSNTGESRTEKILTQFRITQQTITKKFYQAYRGLRLELINNIRHRNPHIDIDIVVEKAQKIIDRIVFIHFCEDKGLLPSDKLKEVIDYGQKAFSPVWQTLTNFFEAVNSGSPKLDIPNGYNGGLFQSDPVLNALVIGEEICKKFVTLGNYDFDDALSVNILGHIFEQSISDLEQLKIDLLGTELKTDELVENKKQSKRKKDGIFYTPEYIVDYIVQNSLMRYLNEKEDECLAKHKDEIKAYQAYQQILHNIKVLDPACGSGAFLVNVFDVLLAENKRVGMIIGGLFDEAETYKSILTNNIYGVDLNPESVEITKLSLWLKSAQKGKKLNNLDKNIKCGNSLIDDPEVAGERAFDWNKEFIEIMKAGGFDIIVGNPPYIFARGGNFSSLEKEYYYAHYKISDYQINTYVLFLEKSFFLLKNNGCLGFIMPNTWLTISSFGELRKFILQYTGDISIINIYDKVFSDANVDTCILNFTKNSDDKIVLGEAYGQVVGILGSFYKKSFNNENAIINISSIKDPLIHKLIEKIEKKSQKLSDISTVSTGVKVYQVGKGKPSQSEEIKNTRAFHSVTQVDSTYIRYLEGKDVNRYYLGRSGEYVSYGDRIAEPRKSIEFSSERILVRQIPSQPPYCINAILTSNHFINDINSMVIVNIKIDPRFLLSIINSRLISYWFQKKFDKLQRGLFPQFKVKELGLFPMKVVSDVLQQPFIEKSNQMLALNKQFHEKIQNILSFFQQKYGLAKISRTLEKFYEGDFATFLKALKVKVPLAEQRELMGMFDKDKADVLVLKNQIDQTDREIDEMVFDLYGLSEEERKVVEQGLKK